MSKTAPQISKLVVHDGVFHADDVLCAAMARSLNPDVWIQRTRRLDPMDIELNGNGVYIADVGGGKYDHHQPDAAVREDGAKYAACGLLYEEWKDALFNTKEGQKYFEDTYVKPIEVTDNGGERNMLSHAIGGLNPSWDQKTDWDAAFYEAVDRMSAILEAERHRVNDLGKTEPAIDDKTLMEAQKMMGAGEFLDASCKDKSLNHYMALQGDMYDGQAKDPLTAGLSALGEVNPEAAKEMVDKILDEDRENVNSAFRARSIVQDAYAKSPDKTSVILESYVPWRDVLPETEAEYVLYETKGQYNIQCVPKGLTGNETKAKLPEEWLSQKPEGCKFVAPARHVCGFDTMEHAKTALDTILKDRTAQIEASKWENQQADYHLTYNNSKENIDFHGFTVQPGFWYGKDLTNGETLHLRRRVISTAILNLIRKGRGIISIHGTTRKNPCMRMLASLRTDTRLRILAAKNPSNSGWKKIMAFPQKITRNTITEKWRSMCRKRMTITSIMDCPILPETKSTFSMHGKPWVLMNTIPRALNGVGGTKQVGLSLTMPRALNQNLTFTMI